VVHLYGLHEAADHFSVELPAALKNSTVVQNPGLSESVFYKQNFAELSAKLVEFNGNQPESQITSTHSINRLIKRSNHGSFSKTQNYHINLKKGKYTIDFYEHWTVQIK
jgi:hypothetical protein